MKKPFHLLILILLIINSVYAFEVSANATNKIIIPNLNQGTEMTITVTNATEGYYNIYTFADVMLDPSTGILLNKGTNELKIKILPLGGLNERGNYIFTYTLKKEKEEQSEKVLLKIYDLSDIIEINSEANEPNSGKITFYIKNKENISLEGLEAQFSSIFFNINEKINLNPYEKQEISVEVDKEELSKINAGLYSITAEFTKDQNKETIEGKIYLGEKKGITTQEDSSGFLIRSHTINKINAGNINELVIISTKKNIFTRLFTNFNIEPDLVDREGLNVHYSWNKELKPSEVFSVNIKTNYLYPLLILIFLAGFSFIFKKYSETDVIIKKSASHVKTKGGEFALKIRLNIKAKKDVENAAVIDKIPDIVKVFDKFESARPSKIDTAGRRLQWNIGDLSKGEERIFNYIVYSKIGIVGKFSLPEATSIFETNGNINEVKSNKIYFLAEQNEKKE